MDKVARWIEEYPEAPCLLDRGFYACNERGVPQVMEQVRGWRMRHPATAKIAHVGFGGTVNYQLAKAVGAELVLLFDVNPRVLELHRAVLGLMDQEWPLPEFRRIVMEIFAKEVSTVPASWWAEIEDPKAAAAQGLQWLHDAELRSYVASLAANRGLAVHRADACNHELFARVGQWLASEGYLVVVYASNIGEWVAGIWDERNDRDYKRFGESLTALRVSNGPLLFAARTFGTESAPRLSTLKVIEQLPSVDELRRGFMFSSS